MIYLILVPILVIVMGGAFRSFWVNGGYYIKPHSFWGSFWSAIGIAWFFAIAEGVAYVVILHISTVDVNHDYTKSYSLVAMNDLSVKEGSMGGVFFLAVGVVGGKYGEVYKVRYATSEYGIVRIKTMEVSDAVGFVEDGLNKLIVSGRYTKPEFTERGKKLFWKDDPNIATTDYEPTYTFHVPQGSITHQYNIDLQ